MTRTTLLVAFLFGAFGCSSEPTAPQAPGPDMAGTWAVWIAQTGFIRPSGGTADDWQPLSCGGSITLLLDDQHGTLTGAFTAGSLACTIGSTMQAVPWVGPITGERTGRNVIFTDGWCSYEGQQTSDHRAAGDVFCDVDTGSTELRADGTWEAVR